MKTLFIFRHAKSSWDQPDLPDFERPLNTRGKSAAPFMGELMAKKGLEPEIIVCSTAKRARQTALLVKESGEFDAEVTFVDGIYEASANALLHIVSEIDEKFSLAMIVGHNPGFENLIAVLSGNYVRFTTANLAVVHLEINKWSETSSGSGNLAEVIKPKDHMKR